MPRMAPHAPKQPGITYSTARAHEPGRTRDWVVIYFQSDHDEHQCTVVTARSGPMAGRRVVRGRERECRAYYAGRH